MSLPFLKRRIQLLKMGLVSEVTTGCGGLRCTETFPAEFRSFPGDPFPTFVCPLILSR